MLLVASLVFHGALAFGVGTVRGSERREVVAITMTEAKKTPPAPTQEPVVAKEAPTPNAASNAKTSPSPTPPSKSTRSASSKPDATPSSANPGFDGPALDLGLSMQGGVGVGGGGGTGGGGPSAPAASAPLVQAPAPKKTEPACDEATTKPKPKGLPTPAYSEAARNAKIEGKVRVEISVSADGKVSAVRLLQGLGYGLDEAALDAARRASFEPASKCGQPVAAVFVIAMRFAL
jgi:protein TonB